MEVGCIIEFLASVVHENEKAYEPSRYLAPKHVRLLPGLASDVDFPLASVSGITISGCSMLVLENGVYVRRTILHVEDIRRFMFYLGHDCGRNNS